MVKAVEPTNAQLMTELRKAMESLKGLRSDVNSTRKDIDSMKVRLHNIESSRPNSRAGSIVSGRIDSAVSSQEEAEIAEVGTEDEAVQAQLSKLQKLASSKGRKSRLEDEKDRGLAIVRQKLRDKEKLGSVSQTEGETSGASSIFGLSDVRKKMTKKQKKACDDKVAGRIGQAGASFPVEDSSSSSSSYAGTDSESDRSRDSQAGRRSRRSRKVKSGAKLVKRPVKQTELWPHTVSNEEDGMELTCDTIGLQRFLACFSSIMVSCGSKAERAGRACLFNAFSQVFECLPWAEARSFHNLVMVKIEQRRIDWKTDFSVLADKFLNHKLRLSLRVKGNAAGQSYHRTGKSSFNKGYGNSSFRQGNSNTSSGKALYFSYCKMWNSGTCTYGDKCRYKHCCWTCAEAGKYGETHKASSHNKSAMGKPQG